MPNPVSRYIPNIRIRCSHVKPHPQSSTMPSTSPAKGPRIATRLISRMVSDNWGAGGAGGSLDCNGAVLGNGRDGSGRGVGRAPQTLDNRFGRRGKFTEKR